MHTRSRKKTTINNIFIRYTNIILAVASGIIMTPLYLKFISVDIYGIWLATGNILVWITVFDPGLSTVLQQRVAFAYGKRDYNYIHEIMSSGLSITVVISGCIIIIGLIFTNYLNLLLELSPDVARTIMQAFFLAVVGSSCMLFSFSLFAINQGLQGSLGCGIIGIITRVFSITLSIFLLYKGYGLLAIAITKLIEGVLFVLGQGAYLIWRLISERIGFRFSFKNVPILLRLLSYSFLGKISGIVANNIDLFVVARFLGPEAVTALSITRKTPYYSKEFVNQPVVAFMPAISHLSGTDEDEKKRNILTRLMRIFIWLLCLCLGGVIVFNYDFVKLWIGANLFTGKSINLMLCLGIFIQLTSYCLGSILVALGNIKGTSIANFVQSILFVGLVIIGTKYFGLLGTALALPISVLAVTAWYFPMSLCRLIKLPFEDWRKIMLEGVFSLSVMLVLVLGLSGFHPRDWGQFFTAVLLFGALYAGFIYLVSKEFRIETGNIGRFLMKWNNEKRI